MSPARIPDGAERGLIIPVGGAEEKMSDARILRRFVEIAGGKDARIAVIPTASQLADTGDRYETLFTELGAGRVRSLPFETRADCDRAELLNKLVTATGVFMTGGNQLRLATTLGGTEVARTIRTLNAAGVPVAGTSAGAAFLSEHMIAHGEDGAVPRANIVALAPGLGLTNRVVIDQHFRQRDRLGRLLTALAYNPFAIGVGLDEDTAAFIGPDETLEVVGSGGITIVDCSNVEYSSMDQVGDHEPVCLIGLRLHILTAGATFNLHTRVAAAPNAAAAQP
jgi:cyanophycinase